MCVTPIQVGPQRRDASILPLNMLNGFLFGIDASRVRPEIREAVISYRRGCYGESETEQLLVRRFDLHGQVHVYRIVGCFKLFCDREFPHAGGVDRRIEHPVKIVWRFQVAPDQRCDPIRAKRPEEKTKLQNDMAELAV